MDQEKFDQHLMDYLFDELDEVTRAAMKRKLEADAHCREIEAGLRATIEVGQLPLEEPSDDLEERILAAVEVAQRGEPWHTKLVRMLSWAGSHAMKPQLAMAALLVLVLGSSLLLLRAKPGAVAVTPTKDDTAAPGPFEPADEQAAEPEPVALPSLPPVPSAEAKAPKAADKEEDSQLAALEERYNRGLKNYDAGNFSEAQKDFDAVSGSASPKSGSAALYKARAVRSASGCGEAVRHYEAVRQRFGNTGLGADATYEQADCYVRMGKTAEARQLWLSLADDPDYKDRALSALASSGQPGTSGKGATAAPKRAARAKPQEAVDAAEADAPPPAGGSTGQAPAAPRPAAQPADPSASSF